jgi:hypothetical protein
MGKLSFKRHRFPPDIICYGVWLYYRFTLSFRDVEELLAQRGIDVSYETLRCWAIKLARRLPSNGRSHSSLAVSMNRFLCAAAVSGVGSSFLFGIGPQHFWAHAVWPMRP